MPCFPPAQATAPAPAGWRNLPTRGLATCSSGGCSTRRWFIRACGARKAILNARTSVSPKMCRTRSITLNASFRRKAILFGDIGLADIAIASFFRNADYAGFAVDPGRWPKVARFVRDTLAHPVFEKLLKYEQVQMGSSIAGRRQALIDAGAKLTAETLR